MRPRVEKGDVLGWTLSNVIPTQERYVTFRYTLRVGVVKTARNIKIYRPRVFGVRSLTN